MPVKTKPKRNKYNAQKIVVDGVEFDSKKESQRYLVLKKAQENGVISSLTLQPKWDALPAKTEKYVKHLKTKDKECVRTVVQPIKYTADFSYMKDGSLVVEDVKPCPSLLSRDVPLKIKLMKFFHGIQVKLVFNPNDPV